MPEASAQTQIIDKHTTGAIVELAVSEKHQGYKDKITQKVEKRIGTKVSTLVKNMLELANGGYWTENRPDGTVLEHYERPNLQANIYLLDRLMGKPTVKQEVKVEKKGIFIIETMIKRLASPAVTVVATEIKNNEESEDDNGELGQPGSIPTDDEAVGSDAL